MRVSMRAGTLLHFGAKATSQQARAFDPHETDPAFARGAPPVRFAGRQHLGRGSAREWPATPPARGRQRHVAHALVFGRCPRRRCLPCDTELGQELERSRPGEQKLGSAIAAGTIRGAQAALGKDGLVHVIWNGSNAKLPQGSHMPLLYTRSTDGGNTFEPQRALSGDWPLDGGGAVAADALGHVHVFWHAGNAMGKDGEITRRVFLRSSEDDGKSFGAERAISPEGLGVCGCCAMQAVASNDGNRVYALFRSAYDNGMSRHIVSLVSHDGGKTFAHAVVDKWSVAACPMSSMSLVAGPRGMIGAWERQGQVYLGLFEKGSASPTQVTAPEGKTGARKHPVLAVDTNGQTLMAWTEGTGWQKGGSLAWQLFDTNFQPMKERGTASGVPVWSFGSVASTPDGFVIVKIGSP